MGYGYSNYGSTQGPSVDVMALSFPQFWEALRQEPKNAEVYFVRRGPFVKIGCSIDVPKRVKSLAYHRDPDGKVGPVQLLLTEQGGRVVEGGYHHRFRASSVDGVGEGATACPAAIERERPDIDWSRHGLHV